jgi:protein kinase C substrate 80K-H
MVGQVQVGAVRFLNEFPICFICYTEASRARQVFHDAENELNRIKRELDNAQKDATEIFDVKKFGRDGEWKKLQNTCMEKEAGEYVQLSLCSFWLLTVYRYIYEVCLFGEAKQKPGPGKGGSTFQLGYDLHLRMSRLTLSRQ